MCNEGAVARYVDRLLFRSGVRVLEILGFGGFADFVGAVEPPAQVDHLAPLAAEWSKRKVLFPLDRQRLSTGWTFKGRHD